MIITRTPFRISFFGGGTDYPVWFKEHGGATLSTSIDKYCYITARTFPPFFGYRVRFVWSKIELVNHADEIEHPTGRETLKFLNMEQDIEVHHHGDLPARAGLGSSSAFVVGLLNALYALKKEEPSKYRLAKDAIHVEQQKLQHNVGCQDHIAASFGGLNKVTYGGKETFKVEPVLVSADRKRALEDSLMLFFTGLARDASEIAGEQIRNTPKKEDELKKMMQMVDSAVAVLKDPKVELAKFGELLHETWQIKRTLSSVISTPQIDNIYDRARKAGAIGGKLLGAGGGGFMLFYVDPKDRQRVRVALAELLHVPFRFDDAGTQVIYNSNGTTIA